MNTLDVQGLRVDARLADISFQLQAGEMLGLIGPNGAGKSTLLNCLANLQPYQGSVLFDGHTVAALSARERAQKIGFLPQAGASAWALRVADVVALGRLPWGDTDARAMQNAVELSGIETLLSRTVDQLSGGEQARVWLARVLAGEPEILLADEPIASLDLFYQRSIMASLRRYASSGRAVVLAIHDLGFAARYCDRLCLLKNGRVHALGLPSDVLTEARVYEVFGVETEIDLQANPPRIIPR